MSRCLSNFSSLTLTAALLDSLAVHDAELGDVEPAMAVAKQAPWSVEFELVEFSAVKMWWLFERWSSLYYSEQSWRVMRRLELRWLWRLQCHCMLCTSWLSSHSFSFVVLSAPHLESESCSDSSRSLQTWCRHQAKRRSASVERSARWRRSGYKFHNEWASDLCALHSAVSDRRMWCICSSRPYDANAAVPSSSARRACDVTGLVLKSRLRQFESDPSCDHSPRWDFELEWCPDSALPPWRCHCENHLDCEFFCVDWGASDVRRFDCTRRIWSWCWISCSKMR